MAVSTECIVETWDNNDHVITENHVKRIMFDHDYICSKTNNQNSDDTTCPSTATKNIKESILNQDNVPGSGIEASDLSSLLEQFLEYEQLTSQPINSLTPVTSPGHCELSNDNSLLFKSFPEMTELTPPATPPCEEDVKVKLQQCRVKNTEEKCKRKCEDEVMSDNHVLSKQQKIEAEFADKVDCDNNNITDIEQCSENNAIDRSLSKSGEDQTNNNVEVTEQLTEVGCEKMAFDNESTVRKHDMNNTVSRCKQNTDKIEKEQRRTYTNKKHHRNEQSLGKYDRESRRKHHSKRTTYDSSSDSDNDRTMKRTKNEYKRNCKPNRHSHKKSYEKYDDRDAKYNRKWIRDIEHERKIDFRLGRSCIRDTAKEERRVVYIGGLAYGTTKDELWSKMRYFGPIEKVTVHFREGERDNYGFITFFETEDARRCVEKGSDELNEPDLDFCFGGRREYCGGSYVDFDSKTSCIEELRETYGNILKNENEDDFDTLLRQYQRDLGQ